MSETTPARTRPERRGTQRLSREPECAREMIAEGKWNGILSNIGCVLYVQMV